jgi:hypothetical protein
MNRLRSEIFGPNQMIRRLLCGLAAWLLVVMATVPAAFAGKLDDFEDSATNPGKSDGDHGRDHDHSDKSYDRTSDDDSVALALLIVALPVYGGLASWHRVRPGEPDLEFEEKRLPARRAGEALLPFARVDAAYQLVESDVDAWDLRAELGFGPFAVQVRETHYDEGEPDNDLDLVQAHFLWRMTVIKQLEIDAGLGGIVVDGKDTNSGVSGTLPILIHPWDFIGLEFRPSWSSVNDNTVSDYDLSLLAGWRFISARAGYRWTNSGGSSLNGPIFGLAARW